MADETLQTAESQQNSQVRVRCNKCWTMQHYIWPRPRRTTTTTTRTPQPPRPLCPLPTTLITATVQYRHSQILWIPSCSPKIDKDWRPLSLYLLSSLPSLLLYLEVNENFCQDFCFTIIHVLGFVSPFISQGLATMSQFEITLPSIRRRNVTEISSTTETSRMLHFIHQMSDEDTRVKVESMILTNTLWLWYKSTLQF